MNVHQITVRIGLAHASGHMAVLGEGVLQNISHHGVVILLVILMGGEEIIDHLERVASIIIIRVDHREGRVHTAQTAQYRVAGSPGFHPSLRNLIAFRNIVEILEHIGNFHDLADSVADSLPEIFFIFFFDDKYNLLKSGLFRVIQGKIHNDMSLRIHRIDLFESAVTASHSGSHDDQRWSSHYQLSSSVIL